MNSKITNMRGEELHLFPPPHICEVKTLARNQFSRYKQFRHIGVQRGEGKWGTVPPPRPRNFYFPWTQYRP